VGITILGARSAPRLHLICRFIYGLVSSVDRPSFYGLDFCEVRFVVPGSVS
jgi:hypothetical protein